MSVSLNLGVSVSVRRLMVIRGSGWLRVCTIFRSVVTSEKS